MKRADKSGARFALVLGEDEVSKGRAQLKPMQGGEPQSLALDELSSLLKTLG
jgi:histidyl-tRNA synthetase